MPTTADKVNSRAESGSMDIQTIEAGLELDARIASLCGWTEIREQEQFIEDFDFYDPVTILTGMQPGVQDRRKVPQYSTNAEAALSLPLNSESWFELVSPGWNNKEWGCKILEHDVPETYPAPLLIHNMEYKGAPTAALAICRAWLTWKRRSSR